MDQTSLRTAYFLVFALSLLLLAIVMLPMKASAQTTCQQIGQFRYCNGQNYNSTQQQLGQFNYLNGTYRDQNGNTRTFSQTCQRIGQFTYCN